MRQDETMDPSSTVNSKLPAWIRDFVLGVGLFTTVLSLAIAAFALYLLSQYKGLEAAGAAGLLFLSWIPGVLGSPLVLIGLLRRGSSRWSPLATGVGFLIPLLAAVYVAFSLVPRRW
jgi:hypothetical protein